MPLEILKSMLFGLVEGITEWLPISSTGHMILLSKFIRPDVTDEFFSVYEVVIQLGAILAVAVLFFERLYPFSASKSQAQKSETLSVWSKVIIAVIPSAAVGFLLDEWLDEKLYNHITVAVALIVYGAAFIAVEGFKRDSAARICDVSGISHAQAFALGVFQTLALVPGTSRSGATILGGMLLGMSRVSASEFSFFMAIPTMLGASLLKLTKLFFSGFHVSFSEWLILGAGGVTAFLVSLMSIRYLMDYVKRHSFRAFGVYRILLGAAVLIFFFF